MEYAQTKIDKIVMRTFLFQLVSLISITASAVDDPKFLYEGRYSSLLARESLLEFELSRPCRCDEPEQKCTITRMSKVAAGHTVLESSGHGDLAFISVSFPIHYHLSTTSIHPLRNPYP